MENFLCDMRDPRDSRDLRDLCVDDLSDLSSELDSRDRSSSSADQNSEGENSCAHVTEVNGNDNEVITEKAKIEARNDRSPPCSPKEVSDKIFAARSPGRFELSTSPSYSPKKLSTGSFGTCFPEELELSVSSAHSSQTLVNQSFGARSPEKSELAKPDCRSPRTLYNESLGPEKAEKQAFNPHPLIKSFENMFRTRPGDVSGAESSSMGTPDSSRSGVGETSVRRRSEVGQESDLAGGDPDSADDVLSTGERSPSSSRASFSQVYSSAPVNISDMMLSDVSLDRSHGIKNIVYSPPKLTDSSMAVIESLAVDITPLPRSVDSERNTPPTLLDSEGAEELSDTASWPRSYSARSLSYFEFSLPQESPIQERSKLSPSSPASQSSLPESPKAKPNLRLLADSWADYATPSTGSAYYMAVSDRHLWCVTNYEHIYYCPTHFSLVTWTQLDGHAKMIAVNNTGDVIWCIDRKNYAYARKGIRASRQVGSSWEPVEKDMRFVAVEETAVWGIKLNGDVFVRTDVSRDNPQGKGWRTIKLNSDFVQASCLDGLIWFLDKECHIHVYKGNSAEPSSWLLEGRCGKVWVGVGSFD